MADRRNFMISDGLSRVFHGCFMALFAVVFLYILAYQQYLPAAAVLAVLILAGIVAVSRKKMHIQISDRRLGITTAVIMGLMAVLMAAAGWMLLPQLKTDMGTVYYSAMEILDKGQLSHEMLEYNTLTGITNMTQNEYFVVYPNNIPYLFLITGYYWIVTSLGISMQSDAGVYMGVLLNITVILASVWLGSRVAKKIMGNRAAAAYLVVSALFIPYYINASRFYTDTLTLPFPLLAVWLYLKIREEASFRKKAWLAAALGSSLCIGFLLKGSCIVAGVAIIIHSLLTSFSKKTCAQIALALACFIGINAGWGYISRHNPWVDMSMEDELTFPVQHWIMMSMSGNGGFHQDEFDYTYSFGTKEEKAKADMDRLAEKIEGYGSLGGFLDFEFKKIAWTWGDAKFAQQAHLNWMQKDTVLNEFIKKDGKYHTVFYLYTSVFILVLYMLFFASMARGMFSRPGAAALINIMIFGVLLFFAFWETKSRYLLNFTPMFFLCGIDGLKAVLAVKVPASVKAGITRMEGGKPTRHKDTKTA